MLEIKNLTVCIEGATILDNFELSIEQGKIIALMGPNGSGKSTLAHVLAGHPSYQVKSGSILFNQQALLEMSPEARAQAGLFLAFQYPASLPGVSVSHFLRLALNAQEKARDLPLTGIAPFLKRTRTYLKQLEIPHTFLQRSLNDGFSGGEKKRMEMLQMLVLQPKLVILDEIDSGLDIDAIKVVAGAISQLDRLHTSVLIITHYQRILNYCLPDQVHIIKAGQLIRSGGPELALQLEAEGYADL